MTTGIGLGALALGLLMLVGKVWRSYQHTTTHFDAQYRTQTEDGWTLGMYRYVPVRPKQQAKAVIILCHELGSSPQLWEADGPDSWPLQLKQMGYDVWSIGLRGTGQSKPRYLDAYHGWGWDVETHLDLDIPALFQTIRLQTNDLPIHWVGHGLGGVLGLLAQSKHKLALTSITVMGVGLQPLKRFGLLGMFIQLWPRPVFPLRWFYRLFSPPIALWRHISGFVQRSILRSENTQSLRMYADLSTHLTPVSTPLLQQWMRWVAQGKWQTSSTKEPLHNTLNTIHCPVLCMSLPNDLLAPETSVFHFFQQLPEPQRSLYEASTEHTGSHFAPLFVPDLRANLIQHMHEWHQTFAPFPQEKKRRKRRKRT